MLAGKSVLHLRDIVTHYNRAEAILYKSHIAEQIVKNIANSRTKLFGVNRCQKRKGIPAAEVTLPA